MRVREIGREREAERWRRGWDIKVEHLYLKSRVSRRERLRQLRRI